MLLLEVHWSAAPAPPVPSSRSTSVMDASVEAPANGSIGPTHSINPLAHRLLLSPTHQSTAAVTDHQRCCQLSCPSAIPNALEQRSGSGSHTGQVSEQYTRTVSLGDPSARAGFPVSSDVVCRVKSRPSNPNPKPQKTRCRHHDDDARQSAPLPYHCCCCCCCS